jgi:3-phosphoshikimate 1-carboxyvinyltransferase
MVLEGRAKLRGTVRVPGDKSISHRVVILSSISSGNCRIRGLSSGLDVQATLNAFRKMGVTIVQEKEMRVVGPLADHGAVIHTRKGLLPVELDGDKLLPIHYSVPVPSAQVKSALMLATLFIEGQSVINEPLGTRDHTERMLLALDAKIRLKDTQHGREIYISGRSELSPIDHTIPGDISSALFFIAAALVLPSSELILSNVLINPTRAYILEVLRRMGGSIEETDDGFVLEGGAGKFPADIQSFGDHRLAMAASIIALGSRGKTVIRDAGCVSVSFPGFFRELNRCTVG